MSPPWGTPPGETTDRVPERAWWRRAGVVVPATGILASVALGLVSGGVGEALVLTSVTVFLGALWHLVSGRRFLGLPGRRFGLALGGLAVVLMVDELGEGGVLLGTEWVGKTLRRACHDATRSLAS